MPSLFEFAVGGLVFECCAFVIGWRHGFQSEAPYIIISIINIMMMIGWRHAFWSETPSNIISISIIYYYYYWLEACFPE